jgi:hypothetical protein
MAGLALLGLAACGDRTGLWVPEEAGVPPIDAAARPDAYRNDCPSASSTLVFVFTDQSELFTFDPTAFTFTQLGMLTCPTRTPGAMPFSMAVDRHGTAYVEFADSVSNTAVIDGLFRVEVSGPTCTSTQFVPNQSGFDLFGMGFTTDQGGPAESLFVAEGDADGGLHALGTLETSTFTLSKIAALSGSIFFPELAGTGDGRLFAFSSATPDPAVKGAFIVQLDKNTGSILARDDLPTVTLGQAWAFAYWGGSFYLFTAPTMTGSIVTQFDPVSGKVNDVATLPSRIVGAGVSTCAPP